MAKIAILDYNAGNLKSVDTAVRHLGGDARVTRDLREIRDAERLIFPGVGAAGASMENLHELGIAEEIQRAFEKGKPILGICIGCQVIFSESEEDGGTACLGLIPGKVIRFRFADDIERKIPHMGWNHVEFRTDMQNAGGLHPVFHGVESGVEFYFVHSYHPAPDSDDHVQAHASYGGVKFSAAVACDTLVAVQFHAEKSGRHGLTILDNFLNWNPS